MEDMGIPEKKIGREGKALESNSDGRNFPITNYLIAFCINAYFCHLKKKKSNRERSSILLPHHILLVIPSYLFTCKYYPKYQNINRTLVLLQVHPQLSRYLWKSLWYCHICIAWNTSYIWNKINSTIIPKLQISIAIIMLAFRQQTAIQSAIYTLVYPSTVACGTCTDLCGIPFFT